MNVQVAPDLVAVVVHAADEDLEERFGPLGGPVTADGVVALRVSLTASGQSSGSVELETVSDAADNQATQGDAALLVQPRPMVFDGSTWDRVRGASATTQAAVTDKAGVQLVLKGSEWSEVGDPAAATQATATRAAGGAGVRHVCTGITACLSADAAASGPIKVRLLDGATTRWVGVLAAPANGAGVIALDDLAIVGTANTAMTLQFDAGGPAGSQQTVTLSGYSVA